MGLGHLGLLKGVDRDLVAHEPSCLDVLTRLCMLHHLLSSHLAQGFNNQYLNKRMNFYYYLYNNYKESTLVCGV